MSPRSGTGDSSFDCGPVRGFTRVGLPLRCAGLLYERSAADQPRVLGVDIVRSLWGRLVGLGQDDREALEEQLRRGRIRTILTGRFVCKIAPTIVLGLIS